MDGVVLHPGVELGEDVRLEAPCVIGRLSDRVREASTGPPPTVIGAGSVVRSFSVVYAGVVLGRDVHLGHGALIREGNVVGDGSSIGSHTVLEGHCTIGRRSRIHSNCFLELATIGDDVFVGPGVVFTDDPHPPCPKYLECGQGVTVEAHAKIGGGAVLAPGVTVGSRALVGAGAVVTKDVAPSAVVAGNPAKVIGDVDSLECFSGLFTRVFEWESSAPGR